MDELWCWNTDMTYTGPERRRHERPSPLADLFVEIDQTIFAVTNCSYGGIVVTNYFGDRKPGAIFPIDAVGQDPEDLEHVTIKARVVRRDDKAAILGLAFLDLDADAYRVLSQAL